MTTRFVVVGGGIVGLATAFKLLRTWPGASVTVLEKERGVGSHQSSHNSGVLHAGLYYKPGSLKARLAVSGIRQMVAFCRVEGVAHEVCGKLVVAVTEGEVPRLKDLFNRGTANGLRGLEWLGSDRIREVEPHVAGVAAVRVPEEGIADYPAVCAILAKRIVELGGRVLTGSGVTALVAEPSGRWRITTSAGEETADFLVNCAGLYSDRVAAMAGERSPISIIPVRGEYFTLSGPSKGLVRNLIYPVPDPAFPFLGVHFTRMIHGGIEAGPNAVLAFAREGYRKRDVRLRELGWAIRSPALWRFIARYPGTTAHEFYRSFSRAEFCRALQRLVPEVRREDLAPGGSGVRAQAMTSSGELVQDFMFIRRSNALHVLNAPSPGATASLAIGDELVKTIAEQVGRVLQPALAGD